MRELAYRKHDPVVSGESGAAGLAGLLKVAKDPSSRKIIGLDDSSRVLLVNTETATDPSSYCSIVGQYPVTVESRCHN